MSSIKEKKIYDNTNLAESYSGVVLPLTVSFARGVYEDVYQNFASFMGVPKKLQQKHHVMFQNMVVGIGSHLYYDINNWYKLVSMLPGYVYNKNFFENMLGIKRSTSEALPVAENNAVKVFSYIRLAFQILKIGIIFLFMPLYVRSFNNRFDLMYRNMSAMELKTMSYESLVGHIHSIHGQLTKLWRIPIANDFAVMVSVGISRRLHKLWLSDDAFITNLQLTSHSRLVTLDPGRLLFLITKSISNDRTIKMMFEKGGDDKEIYKTLMESYGDSKTVSMIHEYILLYGSRVPNELKLETPTIVEEPHSIISLITAVQNSETTQYQDRHKLSDDFDVDRVNIQSLNLLQKLVLNLCNSWVRSSITYREQTRLRRTQIFGHARQVYLCIGNNLVQAGVLELVEDIMYLSTKEVESILNIPNVQAFVENNKKEVHFWKSIDMPTRIETYNDIKHIEAQLRTRGNIKTTFVDVRSGTVASKGGFTKVSGETLVLQEFDKNYTDKILVTKHTDPGWVSVFPFVRAIVVERGGLLSHASIVAREMNIPCIIGVQGATSSIKDGAIIELDLINGEIHDQA
jgi:rifampicin phosphotransferase